MNGVNKCMFVGNLGTDLLMRHTHGGTPVVNISLGVNERIKRGGVWTDNVEWITVVAYGVLAEAAVKKLKTGSSIFVHGRWSSRKWKDSTGHVNKTVDVVAKEIIFLGNIREREFDVGSEPPSYGPQEADTP